MNILTSLLETFSRFQGSLQAPLASGLRILLILTVTWAARGFFERVIRGFLGRLTRDLRDHEEVKRIETLARVFRYLVSVVLTLVGGMLILGEVGVSVAPILGAAGVVGLAVGFGAQSLVKDYFSGLFLLLENQMRHGDVVQIDNTGGVVEDMTLRYVQLRDYEGNVHFIANGSITRVTNRTRGFGCAVIEVGIGYAEDVDQAFTVMREVGAELRADPLWSARILAPLEVAGVERWDPSAVVLRCRFKTAPIEQWNVRREYLRRLKPAFEHAGIEIPFPQLTLQTPRNKRARQPATPLPDDRP